MNIRPWLLTLLVCGFAGPAWADEIEGLVRVVGRSFDAQTLITPEKETLGPHLCGSDLEQRIRHLTPLVVKVSGRWQTKKGGQRECFVADDVKVLRMSSGRDALVGSLVVKDGVYSVSGEGGKVITLSDVPPGLKKLVGKKVIVDGKSPEDPVPAAKPVAATGVKDDAAVKSDVKVVITYQAFP